MINPSGNVTGSHILVELIDLGNSVISNGLYWMVNFPTPIPDSDFQSPADASSICFTMPFPSLGNSDHVVVSVSIGFLLNSKRDALFHCIAYDYCRPD